jgi:hypothetical protein
MNATNAVSKFKFRNLLSLTLIYGSFLIRIISDIQYHDQYTFN